MENKVKSKMIYRLTLVAFVVSIISFALFVAVDQSGSDTSLSLWFFLLLLLIYVSVPLHGVVLIGAVIQLIKGNGSAFWWVYLYLIVSISGHLVVGYSQGAFESQLIDIARYKRSIEEPAQLKLEQAVSRGPSSKIGDVLAALADGANPNAGIFDNRLPYLVIAASRSDVPTIKALLAAGADPNVRASIQYGVIKNPLPLDVVTFSEYNGVAESVELLLAAGANSSQSLMKLGACRRGDLSLYNRIKNSDASVLLDMKDQTCLHHAAETNQIAFLKALLFDPAYKGEKTNEMMSMSNYIGRSPLDVAIARDHFEAAIYIIKAGGKANKEEILKEVLVDQSESSSLDELKALILHDQSGR
ncbi:MAG: hypothetical protein KZQ74_00740 [gamma proteobacterium symbiont of Bathyaustriella thionipta]|nr:hypothetical protein [gamma proteobacterium symbiont of Bathyaustriella thionipta]MCU7951377.1 hypothetical protein [gamma proteobacterium symbiont of Bathyaustriella thionipta]MCU7957930.1 hypothetical protein [gamma proteobacterium symbiont of Bathyaustriella thionipta]MCU7965736.1 hypothetical protein [gamma proteobacterium symbiont of Bathyaustriella thionipta]